MKTITPTEGLNRLYPLPCFFVITVDRDGKPAGMMASWVFQASFEPPMMAVAIGKSKNTHDLIAKAGEFVLAVPNKEMEKEVLIFGNTSGRDVDKFAKARIKTQPSKDVKAPVLTDATMNFECKVVNTVDAGDHTIFIADVLISWVNEGKKALMYMGKEPGKRLFEEF